MRAWAVGQANPLFGMFIVNIALTLKPTTIGTIMSANYFVST